MTLLIWLWWCTDEMRWDARGGMREKKEWFDWKFNCMYLSMFDYISISHGDDYLCVM